MAYAGTPKRSITPGEIVILASGAVVLLFSFFPWFGSNFLNASVNAWDSGLFPLATLVALAGTLMAVQILLDRVLGVSLPARLAEFTWEQIHIFLGVLAFLIAFCYLLLDKGGTGIKYGFYISLLGSVGLVVGAFLIRQERRNLPAVAGGYGAAPAAPTWTPPPAPPPAAPTPPPPPPPPPAPTRQEPPDWAPPPQPPT